MSDTGFHVRIPPRDKFGALKSLSKGPKNPCIPPPSKVPS